MRTGPIVAAATAGLLGAAVAKPSHMHQRLHRRQDWGTWSTTEADPATTTEGWSAWTTQAATSTWADPDVCSPYVVTYTGWVSCEYRAPHGRVR